MRNPEAIIKRFWWIILLIAGLILLAIFLRMREPYSPAALARVEERQKAFNVALADNWQRQPSEEVLVFVREENAEKIAFRHLFFLSAYERNRISTPSCGWVTDECLRYNRKHSPGNCDRYPEDTQVGDILCRTSFLTDEQAFPSEQGRSSEAAADEGCFLAAWAQENGEWRVRDVSVSVLYRYSATAAARLEAMGAVQSSLLENQEVWPSGYSYGITLVYNPLEGCP